MKMLGLRYLIIYKKYERIEIYWTEIEETIEDDFYYELLNSLIKSLMLCHTLNYAIFLYSFRSMNDINETDRGNLQLRVFSVPLSFVCVSIIEDDPQFTG